MNLIKYIVFRQIPFYDGKIPVYFELLVYRQTWSLFQILHNSIDSSECILEFSALQWISVPVIFCTSTYRVQIQLKTINFSLKYKSKIE